MTLLTLKNVLGLTLDGSTPSSMSLGTLHYYNLRTLTKFEDKTLPNNKSPSIDYVEGTDRRGGHIPNPYKR